MINSGGGCALSFARTLKYQHPQPKKGEKTPYLLGPTLVGGRAHQGPSLMFGHAFGAAAALKIQYADKTEALVRLVHVSRPVDASFFAFAVPPNHRRIDRTVTAVEAVSENGAVIARLLVPIPR